MGNLTIRNLDDDLLERLKEQAKANARSMEGEVRVLLQSAVDEAAKRRQEPRAPRVLSAADWDGIAARVRCYMGDKGTPATAVEDIRAWRDAEI